MHYRNYASVEIMVRRLFLFDFVHDAMGSSEFDLIASSTKNEGDDEKII